MITITLYSMGRRIGTMNLPGNMSREEISKEVKKTFNNSVTWTLN